MYGGPEELKGGDPLNHLSIDEEREEGGGPLSEINNQLLSF